MRPASSETGKRYLSGSICGRIYFRAAYCTNNGRKSVQPSLLATALPLQTCDRVSGEDAKERADSDLRWKAALGIGINDRLFASRAEWQLHSNGQSRRDPLVDPGRGLDGCMEAARKWERYSLDWTEAHGR